MAQKAATASYLSSLNHAISKVRRSSELNLGSRTKQHFTAGQEKQTLRLDHPPTEGIRLRNPSANQLHLHPGSRRFRWMMIPSGVCFFAVYLYLLVQVAEWRRRRKVTLTTNNKSLLIVLSGASPSARRCGRICLGVASKKKDNRVITMSHELPPLRAALMKRCSSWEGGD